jgi:hypothetical protein
MKGNNKTVPRYCCLNHHITSPMFHCWNQAFRTVGFLGCSPNKNSSGCREQHGDGSSDHIVHTFPVVWCPGFMVVTPSFTHLSITLSNHRFSNCSLTVNVGFVKLMLDSFCGNRLIKMNIQFCCPVTCATVVVYFSKQSFSMYDNLLLSMIIFVHCSSSLMLPSSDDLRMLT